MIDSFGDHKAIAERWFLRGALNLDTDELFDFGYSPDGRSFALNRGVWLNDLVLISGLNEY
jgi:hypothetical protein